MAVHAIAAQFETFTGLAAPADINRLLARASELIDLYVLTPYAATDAGIATDQDILDALSDATCAQIEWWLATGDETEATARFRSPGVGKLNVTTTGVRLAPRAEDALTRAGLRQGVAI